MMSRNNNRPNSAHGGDAMALADSLKLIRELLRPAAHASAPELVTIAVDAIIAHPDFDACEIFLAPEAATPYAESTGNRCSVHMPLAVCELISTEGLPTVVDDGFVYIQPDLHTRSKDLSGALLGVPIRAGNKMLGGLIVWSQQPDGLMPWHENLLDMAAEIIALACQVQPHTGRNGTTTADPIARREPDGEEDIRRPHASAWLPEAVGSESLYGIIERLPFETRVQELQMQPPSRHNARFMLHIDIDRFRMVREYGGSLSADRVLSIIAELLIGEFAGELLFGRIDIDEFGVILERATPDQATSTAQGLVDKVDALRLSFAGQRHDISISIGVAQVHPGTGGGIAAMRNALQACRAAQAQGGGSVHVYSKRSTRFSVSHSDGRTLNRLTRALKDDDLQLYAQLIARSPQNNDESAPRDMHEILLRMYDSSGELIPAGDFLRAAERHGLSVKLDRWVIRNAFSRIAASAVADDPRHQFCINLSGHSIDDHRLLDFIIEQFAATGLDPRRICFEVTETAAISDIAAAKDFMVALRKLGCAFALDDFGSGHSSFLYLRDLPIDYLKIDGELVRDIDVDSVSLALVRTIDGIGRLMDMKIIAEYVESEVISDAVNEIGCDYLQGYLIAAPVPLEDVLDQQTPSAR